MDKESSLPPPVDYERLGLTPAEEALMIRMWNYGSRGRAAGVWRIVATNGAVTALLIYAVATGSWIVGVVALVWIGYNTAAASICAVRDVPLWHSALTKLEAHLSRIPPQRGAGIVDGENVDP